MVHNAHFSLSELCERINQALNQSFQNQNFWVIADVTNHTYRMGKNVHHFELVEKSTITGNIVARLATKAWGLGAARIEDFEKTTGQLFTQNINVLVHVSVQYHPIFGLQLNLNDIDPHYTLGILEQQKRATLEKLLIENPSYISRYGDQFVTKNKSLTLSPVIQKIALISGHTSAGAEDFKHTLLHNTFGYTFEVDDYPTPVQGSNNAEQLLAKIIEIFQSSKPYDAVVITRGGGAQSDFLIFDHYLIGRAVARFPIPIITGIGHQKDETITDLMAHSPTKTPTKAAEFVLAHNKAFEDKMLSFRKNIMIRAQQLCSHHWKVLQQVHYFVFNNARNNLALHKGNMVMRSQEIIKSTNAIIDNLRSELISKTAPLLYHPSTSINKHQMDLIQTHKDICNAQARYLAMQKNNLAHYQSFFHTLSPENILKKGFALLLTKHHIAAKAGDIQIGDDLDLLFGAERIQVTVKQKIKNNEATINL